MKEVLAQKQRLWVFFITKTPTGKNLVMALKSSCISAAWGSLITFMVSPLYTVPDFWENLLHDLNRIDTWELIVCQTKVNLSRLKIDEQFSFSEASVKNVCELVSKLKLCNGDSKTDITNLNLEENSVLSRENWGSSDGTNTKVIRSIQCRRVLPVTSLVSVCIGCRKN
jgi:hypothetical protein